ncbi:MAG TPA: SLBB domain-containing protein [Longimicrobium sp.]
MQAVRRIFLPARLAPVLGLLAACLLAAPVAAQGQAQRQRQGQSAARDTVPERPRASAPVDAPAAAAPPAALPTGLAGEPLLDRPVSRAEYRLGPGDVVDVAVFGEVNRSATVTVSPEGTVLVPEIGVARVLGLNLDEAQERVRQVVYRYYRNVDVALTLARVRTFKVYLLGNVSSPGMRVATAATRVSEVLPPFADDVHRRTVILRHRGGDSVRVDLARFLQLGDLAANPTLREGDAVVVPAVDRTVHVYGNVRYPGRYDFFTGETLADLLEVVNGGGGFLSDAADTVRISRFEPGGPRQFLAMHRDQALGPQGRAFVLRDADAVYVPVLGNFREQKVATVRGQVVRPGIYPVRPDTTTVRELVAMAGGFTPLASLSEAVLRRLPADTTDAALRQLRSIPPELLTDDERQILSVRSQADPTRVVVDFRRLFAEGAQALEQTVEAGDVLDVPERASGVQVLGAVNRPGIVQYAPGRGVDAYVAQAGGFARRAATGNVIVLRAGTGSRVAARDVATLDAGDQVIVPFRQRRDSLRYLQTAQAVVGTIAGFVFLYLTVRNNFFTNNP